MNSSGDITIWVVPCDDLILAHVEPVVKIE